jgi:hypothetical protein
MASGTWTGTLSPPGGQGIDVTFEVSGAGEDLAILLVWLEEAPPEVEDMQLQEIARSDAALMFVLPIPNVRIVCELEGDDGGAYEGDCNGDDGQSGHLRMIPPS